MLSHSFSEVGEQEQQRSPWCTSHHSCLAEEESTAVELPCCLHWRPLEKNSPLSRIKTSSRQPALCRKSKALGRTFACHIPLWPGISGYRGALWTCNKRCKPPSVIRKHVLLKADSRTKSVQIRHLLQSSFQVTFKSMPKRAHLDLHILRMSGECPERKGFSE